MTKADAQNKAICYLCLATDGKHTAECEATPPFAVPLGAGKWWRVGVRAAKKVQKHCPSDSTDDCEIFHQHRDGEIRPEDCIGQPHYCTTHGTTFTAPNPCPKGRGALRRS